MNPTSFIFYLRYVTHNISQFVSISIPTFGMRNGDFDGELRLRSVTRDNKMDGNYTCYVENQSGSDSSTFQVYVQGNFIWDFITSLFAMNQIHFAAH